MIEEQGAVGAANAVQVGGSHYKDKSIQPWDYIVQNEIPYLEGNIIKYVSRWRDKGGVDDLRKAQHYLTKLIEINTQDGKAT
jgi:hypothetical protein